MEAAAEGNPPGTASSAAIWLTKFLSLLGKLTSKLTISSKNAGPQPPPVLPISVSAVNINNDLHPIIQMMREQELGRAIINLAVPVAVAALISCHGELLVAHVVVAGLMTGCMGIWNGILFRTTFPRLANVLEQVGISLVLLSLHAYASSFLPKGFSWVLWLSGAFCLLPFILARILREKDMQASEQLV